MLMTIFQKKKQSRARHRKVKVWNLYADVLYVFFLLAQQNVFELQVAMHFTWNHRQRLQCS